MIINCKMPDAQCPFDHKICCHICEDRQSCAAACDLVDPGQPCEYAETVVEELAQFEAAAPDVIRKISDLIVLKKQLEEQEKQLKVALVTAMEAHNVKSFENDLVKMVYVAPTTRTSVDIARFKADYPGIAERYVKTSMVGSSVRITVKGGGKK